MKALFCLAIGWGLSGPATAQAPLEVRYAPAVVALRVNDNDNEGGSGFVVGSTPDSVYIATAGHVLKNPTAAVKVTFFGLAQALPAQVRFYRYAGGHDLALLAVAARAYRWVPWAMAPSLTPADALYFIRPLTQRGAAPGEYCYDWAKLPSDGQGELLLTNHRAQTIHFELAGVEQGDSGSALLVEAAGEVRIVGMMVQRGTGTGLSTGTALSIKYIKQMLLPILGPKWQLPD